MLLSIDELTARNKRAGFMALAGLAGVFVLLALVSLLFRIPIVAVLLVLLGVGSAAAVLLTSDRFALAQAGARPADEHEHARLHNLTEGLCVAHGIPEPALYVVDDEAANAFAVGRDQRHASIVVTTGLLEVLGPIELEGVLAQELSHIKACDTLPSTIACVIFPAASMLASEREVWADQAAVEMTRYPPGLIAALEKMRDRGTFVQARSRFVSHLWMESPSASEAAERSSGHLTIDDRIATLREL